jgi:hypothetical protein
MRQRYVRHASSSLAGAAVLLAPPLPTAVAAVAAAAAAVVAAPAAAEPPPSVGNGPDADDTSMPRTELASVAGLAAAGDHSCTISVVCANVVRATLSVVVLAHLR